MGTHRRLPLIVLLLLAIAASRILRMRGLEMNADEVWSIWQTFGTPRQVLAWVPYDWPPLYFLTLAGWKELVGINPVALRYLSVLLTLFGSASLYRLTARMFTPAAGLLATAVYGALGYAIYLGVLVRGYIAVYALLPFVMLLMLRYFDRPRPARGVALAIGLAVMFYTYFTSPVAFAVLGLYTLVVYRRAIWRWWLPGGLALLLALPEVIAKLDLLRSHDKAARSIELPSLSKALDRLFVTYYTGNAPLFWGVLFALATVLAVIYRRRFPRGKLWFMLGWPVLGALSMYVLNPVLGFFQPTYSWWVMVGLALWIGVGLSCLPVPGQTAALLALGGLMFLPIPVETYHSDVADPPMIASFEWLRAHLMPEDVVLLDPNIDFPMEVWDYFERVYFPDGLRYVHEPGDFPRVWYVSQVTAEDPDTMAAVNAGRMPGIFVGPPSLLIRLFEGPPDPVGIPFSSGLRFHGADVIDGGRLSQGPIVRHEGEQVRLRLWWSVDAAPLVADYSIGTYIFDPHDRMIAQFDGPPQVTGDPWETSRWQTGRYYVEERAITLPEGLESGTYGLYLAVYQWWDSVRLTAPPTDDQGRLKLAKVYIKAW